MVAVLSTTDGMPRCLLSATTISGSLQKPFCTRMAPSLPPHCFWWPSALCSWCSSTTPSSVRSCPRRLRGGIRSPFLPLHPRQVLVARKDSFFDQQLHHRLERGHRAALGFLHAAQHVDRARTRSAVGGDRGPRCGGGGGR